MQGTVEWERRIRLGPDIGASHHPLHCPSDLTGLSYSLPLFTYFTHLIYFQLATTIQTHCQNLFLWEQERITQGLRDSFLFSPFYRSISTLQIYTHHSFPLTSCQRLCHFNSLGTSVHIGYCLLPVSIIPLPYSGPRNFQVKCAERIRSYFNTGFKK